jgi:hypothetical protein
MGLSPDPALDGARAMTASASPTPADPGVKSSRCPRCGLMFDCGRHAEPFNCWCMTLPPLPVNQVDPRGRCMCPECLATSVAGEAPVRAGETPG